jgi:hypothetical protein
MLLKYLSFKMDRVLVFGKKTFETSKLLLTKKKNE